MKISGELFTCVLKGHIRTIPKICRVPPCCFSLQEFFLSLGIEGTDIWIYLKWLWMSTWKRNTLGGRRGINRQTTLDSGNPLSWKELETGRVLGEKLYMIGSILLFLKPPLTFWDAEFQVRPLLRKSTDILVLFLSSGCIHIPLLQGQGALWVVDGMTAVMGFACSPLGVTPEPLVLLFDGEFLAGAELFPIGSDSVVSFSFPSVMGLLCWEEQLNIEKVVSMLGKSLKRYVGFPTVLVVCLCRRLVGCWFFLVFLS